MSLASLERRIDVPGISLRSGQIPNSKNQTDTITDIGFYYAERFGAVAEQLHSAIPGIMDHMGAKFGVLPRVKSISVRPVEHLYGEYNPDPEIRAVVISPYTPEYARIPALVHELWHDVDVYQSQIFKRGPYPQNLGNPGVFFIVRGLADVGHAIDEGTAELVQLDYDSVLRKKHGITLDSPGLNYINKIVTCGSPGFMYKGSIHTSITPEALAFDEFHQIMTESRNKFDALIRLGGKIRQGTEISSGRDGGLDIYDNHVMGLVMTLHYLAMHANNLQKAISHIRERNAIEIVKEIRNAVHHKPKIFDELYELAYTKKGK